MECWLPVTIHETGIGTQRSEGVSDNMKSCIHIYCGDGKGKTTAAAGLAARMAGHGKKVLFVQFFKGGETGEINLFSTLPQFQIFRIEKPFPFTFQMNETQKRELRELHNDLLRRALEKCRREEISLAVLDEVFPALQEDLLDEALLREFLSEQSERIELVMTGRTPPQDYLDRADYITEMTMRKHPYAKGLEARLGVEY